MSRLVPCMLIATDDWADCSCGNPELLGEERFGQQVLGNMTTCGEKTSLVKSVSLWGYQDDCAGHWFHEQKLLGPPHSWGP